MPARSFLFYSGLNQTRQACGETFWSCFDISRYVIYSVWKCMISLAAAVEVGEGSGSGSGDHPDDYIYYGDDDYYYTPLEMEGYYWQ